MKEKLYEDLLNINTTGEELWSDKVKHYHPYQATSYEALDTLFKDYKIYKEDYIVDFGCGKGRLNFYINYFFKAKVMGIEMDEKYYKECLLNKESYLNKKKRKSEDIDFRCCLAQEYEINYLQNKFYFFNPFSISIFRKIVNNILDSYYLYQRNIDIVLYYPSNEYVYFLEDETPFVLKQEIILNELYNKDNQERFMIYSI